MVYSVYTLICYFLIPSIYIDNVYKIPSSFHTIQFFLYTLSIFYFILYQSLSVLYYSSFVRSFFLFLFFNILCIVSMYLYILRTKYKNKNNNNKTGFNFNIILYVIISALCLKLFDFIIHFSSIFLIILYRYIFLYQLRFISIFSIQFER